MPEIDPTSKPGGACQAAAPAVQRSPVVFGDSPHLCAGWLHGVRGSVGVVICAPLGAEEECTHRSLLHLADGLAGQGMLALRFDYPGTGDSEGENPESVRLNDWIDSVERAASFLRSEAGCMHIALIGLRLGAAVAGTAAARTGAEWMVLWAPVSHGRTYARELHAVAAFGSEETHNGDAIGVAGHLYAPQFIDAITTLRAQDWDLSSVRRTLLLERDDGVPDERLRKTLLASGTELTQLSFAGYPAMFDRPQDAVVPTQAVTTLCDWMATVVSDTFAPGDIGKPCTSSAGWVTAEATLQTLDYQEKRLMVGTPRLLAGVLCAPDNGHISGPLVLLLNAGSVHHTGPGRLYTRLARELVRLGISSLRVDLSMLGDSIVPGAAEENDCYAATSLDEIMDLLEDVYDRLGFRDLILSGLCSGAFWALQGAIDPRARGLRAIAMINPLVIGHRPQGIRSGGLEASEALRYRQSMRSWSKWKKVLTLRAHLGTALVVMARRGISAFTAALLDTARRFGLCAPNEIGQGLRRLRDEHVVIGLFVGSAEPGYVLLRQESPREVAAGQHASTIQVFSLAHCDHTFTSEAAKQRLFRSFSSFVEGLRT